MELGPSHTTTQHLPSQRMSRDPSHIKQLSLVVTQCLLTGAVIVLSVLLLVIISSRSRLRKEFFKQCIASLATSGALFSLLARPGAIHEDTVASMLTNQYCGFYLTILDVESIVVAYTMLVITAERIVAVSEPLVYSKRFNSIGKAALLAFPWAFGLVYGLIRTFTLTDGIVAHYGAFPDDPYYNKHSELATGQCMLIFYDKDDYMRLLIGDLVATEVPIVAIVISSLVLVIIYCKHQRVSQGATNLDLDLERPTVSRGSIALVLILNLTLVIGLVTDFIFTTAVASWGNSHWKICVFELLVAILAPSCLPEVREQLDRMFCCHDNVEDREALISVTLNDGEESEHRVPALA